MSPPSTPARRPITEDESADVASWKARFDRLVGKGRLPGAPTLHGAARLPMMDQMNGV
jgi:hypothetical protein